MQILTYFAYNFRIIEPIPYKRNALLNIVDTNFTSLISIEVTTGFGFYLTTNVIYHNKLTTCLTTLT